MGIKCDILYIHATKNPVGEDCLRYAYMPMGIIGILNGLRKKGISVVGMNFAIEKTLDPQFDLAAALRDMEYKIFMTDLHWYEHAFGAIYAVEQSKKVHPDIPTIIGGYSTTIYAQEIMENFPVVDYALTGDSDLPAELLVEYLLGKSEGSQDMLPNLYYRKDNQVVCSSQKWVQTSLDDIDFLSVDFFLHSEYVPLLTCSGATGRHPQRWIEIARGCKFNCAYCCGANKNMKALFNRCNILTRSPEKVAADFKALDDSGIVHICPSHDFQMFGKSYYRKVCQEIRKLGVRPGLYLECFQLPTKDFLEELLNTFDHKKMVIVISPISGNEELRERNGKIFSNEAFYDTLDFLITHKIPLQLYYTLNLVDETEDQFMDTYFQIKYVHDLLGLGKNQVFYQRVVMDPLAGMRDFKGIEVSINTFMDYYRYCQVPTGDYTLTGFVDNGEVPADKKIEMFRSIMG